jgi:hypothetical protein
MAGEHAERGRRTNHLPCRRHLPVRDRLLGGRQPVQLIFGKSWTCPDRALFRPWLVPGLCSARTEGHSRRAFGRRLPLGKRLLGGRDAKRLALGQPDRALRRGVTLDDDQHPKPAGRTGSGDLPTLARPVLGGWILERLPPRDCVPARWEPVELCETSSDSGVIRPGERRGLRNT